MIFSRQRTSAKSAPITTAALLGAAALGLTVGCNSAKSPSSSTSQAGVYTSGPGGQPFFIDESFGGETSQVRITRQFYGRLVSIENINGMIVHEEFVVDPRNETSWDENRFVLRTNEVTGQQTLVILADNTDTSTPTVGALTGQQTFTAWLREAEAGVKPIADNGFTGSGSFTMVPRNAAVVFQFSDIIDPATLNAMSVRVLVDEPTVTPFEARTILDPNHGDLADYDGQPGLEFYSTRLIVDPAISELESFNANPPVNVNTRGLPASIDVNVANVEVRFPTLSMTGQIQPILQNPSGHGLTTAQNGTFDFGTTNRELVRAFRSGGRTEVTNDPSNGFLPDVTAPKLVGNASASIVSPPVHEPTAESALRYRIDRLAFASTTCAPAPSAGDIIAQVPYFSRVLARPDGSTYVVNNGEVEELYVELIVLPLNFTGPEQYANSGAGPVQYRAPYDPSVSSACFVEVSPRPVGFPNDPATGIRTDSTFTIRFNEPIDPAPFEPYEGLALLRKPLPTVATDYIPADFSNNSTFQEFTFRPALPLTHLAGNSESYFLRLTAGSEGPRDLAGNFADVLPSGTIEYTVDGAEDEQLTGGRVSRFSSPDEEFPFATVGGGTIAELARTEYSGNIEFDIAQGSVRPRSVVRTQVVMSQDPGNPLPTAMFPGTVPTSLPLNPLGARTQFLWRYVDFNMPLYRNYDVLDKVDESGLDLDVEGILLSPLGSNPVFESYPQFSIAMSHSLALPDEVVTPQNALIFPQSGLGPNFSANSVSQTVDPPQIVHRRERGYTVNPGDRETAADGTVLIPVGLNQGLPIEQWETYTWRDTSINALGGINGGGAPPSRVAQIEGRSAFMPAIIMMVVVCNMQGAANPLYANTQIRTAGLPLLIDMKCYPSTGTSSQNAFAHAIAHGTTLPGFRAYSAGGIDQSGSLVIIDPDAETQASGGFDPTSTPTGVPLPGVDNTVYFGALDLVTRVSRMHSIFFPAYRTSLGPIVAGPLDPQTELGQLTYGNPAWLEPMVVPNTQPTGTRLEFQYRGARDVGATGGLGTTVLDAEPATWGTRMDPYGDFFNETQINFSPPDVTDPLEEFLGLNTSCFDSSIQYQDGFQNQGVVFASNGDIWQNEVSDISGIEADWIQVRVTFINNIATGQFPTISALALSWEEQ